MFSCTREPDNLEMIINSCTLSEETYLSVAIPNNIFFSKLHYRSVEMTGPMTSKIDFLQPIRYDIFLYSALNLKQLLLRRVQSLYPADFDLIRFVFDELSVTGKCLKCKGSGNVSAIPIDFFLSEGELSKSCAKFLNSSTRYKEIKKLLKAKYKLDIGKKYSEMNDSEKLILFSGIEGNPEIDTGDLDWRGITELFLQYHKYYPDDTADTAFKKKKSVSCPICNGKRIQAPFTSYTVWNLHFGEIMSMTISQLYNHIRKNNEQTVTDIPIVATLEHMIRLGLQDYTLSDSLLSIKTPDSQLINLITRYTNNIYGTLILIENLNVLDDARRAYIMQLAESWKSTNTVIVMK